MPKKVLIIDDDISLLKNLSNDLAKLDYSVSINSNGKNLPEQIEQENPDIVLLQIYFNENSSIEIAQYLNSLNLPFIFLSNPKAQQINSTAHSSGALGILLKPININQLTIEIETALHLHGEKVLLDRRQENINSTIENNRTISVSIGIIMERFQINSPQSFELIRSAARSRQCRILDIANKLIEQHESSLIANNNLEKINSNKKDKSSNDEMLAEILKGIHRLFESNPNQA